MRILSYCDDFPHYSKEPDFYHCTVLATLLFCLRNMQFKMIFKRCKELDLVTLHALKPALTRVQANVVSLFNSHVYVHMDVAVCVQVHVSVCGHRCAHLIYYSSAVQ